MFTCFGATLLFCGLMDHYSYHSGFNGFYFTTFSFFTPFYIVGLLLLLSPFAIKI